MKVSLESPAVPSLAGVGVGRQLYESPKPRTDLQPLTETYQGWFNFNKEEGKCSGIGTPWWSSGQYAVLPLQGGMGFIPGHTHGVAKNLKKGEGGRYKPSDKLFTMDLKDLVESGIQAVIKE